MISPHLSPRRLLPVMAILGVFGTGLGLALAGKRRAGAERFPGPLNMDPPPIATDKSVKYDYDIVYVRAPRKDADGRSRWAEVGDPRTMEPGADLMLLHPDGKEEVLVAVEGQRVDRRPVRLLRRPVGLLRQVPRRQEPQGLGHLQGPRADAEGRPAHAAGLHAQHRGGRLVEDAAARLGRLQPRAVPAARRQAGLRQRPQRLQGDQPRLRPQRPGPATVRHGRRRRQRRVHRPPEPRHGPAPGHPQGRPDHVQLAGIAGAAQPSPVGRLDDPSRRHATGGRSSAPSRSATARPTRPTSRRSSPTAASSSSRTTTSTTSASAPTTSSRRRPPEGYPAFGPGYKTDPRNAPLRHGRHADGRRHLHPASRSARTASRR